MTSLESKISALLADCANLLDPVRVTAQKWVIINKTQKQLQSVEDEQSSAAIAYGRAHAKIAALPSYTLAKEAFERDKVFRDGLKTAGYWATFDSVVQSVIRDGAYLNKKGLSIDHAQALRSFRSYRDILTSSLLQYETRVRLFGVNLTRRSLTLPDGVTLHRLNMRERNERQPVLQAYLPSGWEDHDLGDHPAELRVPVSVPVDHSEEGAFFKAHNAAQQVAGEIFSKVLQAIIITFSGMARLGYVELKGGFERLPTSRSLSREFHPHLNIIIGPRDLSKISLAYDLVSGGKRIDATLSRALHRFILGRQRSDLVDKLVDYVIAWEAILLTQDGNPITQELSYRFALNGASILSVANRGNAPKLIYKKMRSAYSTRSAIIHGGDDTVRDKALQTGDFKSLYELCDFLESNFRLVVFWLSAIAQDARPYRAHAGWETLIWPH